MADNGVRALAPLSNLLGTALATILTVDPNREDTITFQRATNTTGTDQTVTVTVGGGEVCFNAPVKAYKSVNIFGPDFATLPAGTVVQARASSASAIRLVTCRTQRDV